MLLSLTGKRILNMTSINTASASTASKKVVQPEWFVPKASTKTPSLHLYNSLTRSKTEFVPIKPGHITWYCCGPTVYDHSHLGHARNYVSTDICRRILQDYFGYNIKFIQNVTDIDDKIIIAARQDYLYREKISSVYTSVTSELSDLAKQYLAEYIITNLGDFSKDIEKDFLPWVASLDVAELSKESPKLPMRIKAASDAHSAIYSTTTSYDDFITKIREVAMPALDKQFGNSVTDPSIFRELPSYWEQKFDQDMARLNVLPSTITTRVSEYVPDIIEFVEKIVANGFAYSTTDGSVYFDTVKFEHDSNHAYAKLQPWNKGNLSLINDGEGSLSTGQTKKNTADFALWKGSKPGEPSWPSPWGEGRPGWHIECSVMASDITGETMDIHSGGIDLCFPHHDNELAQSEAYFDNKQWVNYFLHNGHLHIQGQKMSKSLKNFITIEEALAEFTPRQLRLVFAMSAWDKPLDFKDSLIAEVKAYESTLSKFFTTVRALNNDYKHTLAEGGYVSKKLSSVEKQLHQDLATAQDDVDVAFNDNLSSPQALRVLQELVGKSNNYIQQTASGEVELRIDVLLQITNWIVKILKIVGLDTRSDNLGWVDAGAESSAASTEDVALPFVKAFSQFRDTIRNLAINKSEVSEFLKSTDAIRSELINLGVSLDDRPNGSALVKFLNSQEKEQLIKQQQDKENAAAEKEKKKQQQQAVNAAKEQERLAKAKINPVDLFRDTSLYSEWDEAGLPLKDAKGEEVTKSMKKKLTKQLQQQEKLYQEYLKNQS